MPRRGYQPSKVSAATRARADEIRQKASSWIDQGYRAARYLDGFTRENVALVHEDPKDALDLFLAQLSLDGVKYSTMEGYRKTIQKFGLRPGMPLADMCYRVRRQALANGAKRLIANERRNVRVDALPNDEIRSILEGNASSQPDLDYRTLFFLALATGNRVENIMVAHRFRIREGTLGVEWGRRKVRPPPNRTTCYSLKWSMGAPPQLRRRICQLQDRPWVFASSSNIASAFDAWLKVKHPEIAMTSSYPRRRMVTILLDLVDEGGMRQDVYEVLLDQTTKIGRAHYQLQQPASTLYL